MQFTVTRQLSCAGKVIGKDVAQLRAQLTGIEQADSLQVVLDPEDGEGLTAYFNPHRAWLL